MKLELHLLSAFLLTSLLLVSCGKKDNNDSDTSSVSNQTETTKQMLEPTPLSPVTQTGPLAAQWDGGQITITQVDNILGPRKEKILAGTNQKNPIPALAEERRGIINIWIENSLLIQEAYSRNLSLTPAEKDMLLRKFKGKYDTEEEYQKDLQQAGQTEENLLKTLSGIELGSKCIQEETDNIKKSITPESTRAYYQDKLKDFFTSPTQCKVNQVDIWAGDKRTLEEAETFARELYKQVKEGMGDAVKSATDPLTAKRRVIQNCAYEHSDSGDGQYNYGYVTVYPETEEYKESYAPEYLEATLKCKVGELSEVVRTKNGYGFFLMMEQTLSKALPFDAVEQMIPNMIIKMKMDEWRESLKKKYHVIFFDDNLLDCAPVPQATLTVP